MKYNFDEIINRYGTSSVKYDDIKSWEASADKDTIPLCVADMDFKTAAPIIDAMHRVADYGTYGYTNIAGEPQYIPAIQRWFRLRHNFAIYPEEIFYSPGTIPAINTIISLFTNPGDRVILSRPVYGHFTDCILNECFRDVVDSHLVLTDNGQYVMDFDDIEKKCADPKNRIFLLCNPHNPVGRVWTAEELKTLISICQKHNVLLISDEVHGDIVRKGIQYHPILSVAHNPDNIIMLTAVNKTFNLAGLLCANIIIRDSKLRAYFKEKYLVPNTTPFAVAALVAAYNSGEEWLEQLIDYIDGNIDWVLSFLKDEMPLVKAVRPEGTYCMWLDFSEYHLPPEEIHRRIYREANVLLQDGTVHDPEFGGQFQRVCVPLPRAVLKEAFQRIKSVF